MYRQSMCAKSHPPMSHPSFDWWVTQSYLSPLQCPLRILPFKTNISPCIPHYFLISVIHKKILNISSTSNAFYELNTIKQTLFLNSSFVIDKIWIYLPLFLRKFSKIMLLFTLKLLIIKLWKIFSVVILNLWHNSYFLSKCHLVHI